MSPDKKNHTLLRLSQQTMSRIDEVYRELGRRTYDETLSVLVDEHYILGQVVTLLEPVSEQLGTQSPLLALQTLLSDGGLTSVDQREGSHWKTGFQDVSVEQLTPECLGLEASVVGKIREGMEHSHEQDFKAFLSKALVKEAHIRIGMAQRYKEVDLTVLRTLELEKQHKSAELTQERIRRAVITLMLYNQQQPHPKLRARITQTAVHDLMGGRFDHIREFLEKHQQAIAEHHRNLEVPEKRSARVDLGAIRIPEEPEVFGSLFL